MTSQIQSARPNAAATPEAKRRSSAALQKLRDPSPPFDLASYLRSQASPLIIVAHPDDEVLGVGAQLKHWPEILRHRGGRIPEIVEMTSYHNRLGSFAPVSFCLARSVG